MLNLPLCIPVYDFISFFGNVAFFCHLHLEKIKQCKWLSNFVARNVDNDAKNTIQFTLSFFSSPAPPCFKKLKSINANNNANNKKVINGENNVKSYLHHRCGHCALLGGEDRPSHAFYVHLPLLKIE